MINLKRKKVIVLVCFLGLLSFGGYKVYKYIDNEKKAWKVEIINDFINVRDDKTIWTKKIGEVKKGEIYKVLDIYLDDNTYVWYKISLRKDESGWISSPRKEASVTEINNPNAQDYSEGIVDYSKPIIKFYTNDYYTHDIDSINTDHLEIIEDSKYTINYEVYFEEHPKDRNTPQYWIKWMVEDANGYKSSKVQRVIFEVNPDKSRVKLFEDLK